MPRDLASSRGPSRSDGGVPADFRCRQCGNCCRPRGYVRISGADTVRMAAALGMPVRAFTERYTRLTADRTGLSLTEKPDGSCVFLTDAGVCEINDIKPRQCRDFPLKWRFSGFEKICRGMEKET